MKNFALALIKIYGPAGLEDLIALLHHGRTANCVINGTDFDKTCSFLFQSWEAMYRLEVDIFLDYLENGSGEGAASAFSKESFMKEVSSRMKSWKSVKETHETYINAFE